MSDLENISLIFCGFLTDRDNKPTVLSDAIGLAYTASRAKFAHHIEIHFGEVIKRFVIACKGPCSILTHHIGTRVADMGAVEQRLRLGRQVDQNENGGRPVHWFVRLVCPVELINRGE